MRHALLLSILFLSTCAEPTPEQHWVYKMEARCGTMHGELYYDPDKHYVECNKVMYRIPQSVFKETFEQ